MYMFIICSSTVSFATPTDDLDKLTFSAEVFVREVNFSESGDERNASFDNVSISLNDGIQVSGTLTYFDEQEDLTLQGDIKEGKSESKTYRYINIHYVSYKHSTHP